MSVYRYFKEWHKNPHWSFSCCLALLLPLNDLQGEMSGLAESQVKSAAMEMPTILIAVESNGEGKESEVKYGAQDKQSSDDTIETRECNFQGTKSNKFNQGTQTKLLMLSSMKTK